MKNKIVKNTLICYSLIIFLFVVIRLLSSDFFGVLGELSTVERYIANASIQIILFLVSVFLFKFLQKSKTKDVLKSYGYHKISWKAVLYSILIGIIVYILNVFVVTFFNSVLASLGYRFSTSSSSGSYPFWLFIVNIICTAVLPGICEETAHRGMLLKGLSRLGTQKAIVISSLLFGLLHMNITQFFYATLIGFFLGYLATLTDNIYPAIIIHFMNNALSVFMSFSSANNLGLENMFSWLTYNLNNNTIIAILFIFVLSALLIIALRWLVKALYKETALKKMYALQEAIFTEYMRTTFKQEVEEITSGQTDNVKRAQDMNRRMEEIIRSQSGEFEEPIEVFQRPYKMDTLSKILLISCFLLTGLVTLMTFVFGVL